MGADSAMFSADCKSPRARHSEYCMIFNRINTHVHPTVLLGVLPVKVVI